MKTSFYTNITTVHVFVSVLWMYLFMLAGNILNSVVQYWHFCQTQIVNTCQVTLFIES